MRSPTRAEAFVLVAVVGTAGVAQAEPVPHQIVVISESYGACTFDVVTPFAPCAFEIVRMRANAEGAQLRIQNLSLPGVGTAQVWAQHIDSLTSPLQCWFRPCWGIVMLGFSDPKFGRTHWNFLHDLGTISDRLVAIGASRIILVVETSLFPDGFEAARELQRLVQLGMCLARPELYTCVDLSRMDPWHFWPQPVPTAGVHPNAAGQRLIADAIWMAIAR